MYNYSENDNEAFRGITSESNYGNYGNGSDDNYYGRGELGNGSNGINDSYYYGYYDDYYYDNISINYNTISGGYREIGKIIPPFLIVFGTLGSVLILLVFTRSSVYKDSKSTKTFMCALAVSDLISLYAGPFRVWLYRLDVFPASLFTSGLFFKVFMWTNSSFLHFSSWILVAVTIERVIATCNVFIVKKMCTQRLAKVYLIASGITFIVINSYSMFPFMIIYYKIYFWIFTALYCLIPFTVICVGNGIILFQLKRSHLRLKKHSASPLADTGTKRNETCTRGRAKASTWTVKALLINTAFLISTFPYALLQIINQTPVSYDLPGQTLLTLIYISNDIAYLNNTLNICVYCISGAKFRQGLVEVFPAFSRCRQGNTSGTLFLNRQLEANTNAKEHNVSPRGYTNVIPKSET